MLARIARGEKGKGKEEESRRPPIGNYPAGPGVAFACISGRFYGDVRSPRTPYLRGRGIRRNASQLDSSQRTQRTTRIESMAPVCKACRNDNIKNRQRRRSDNQRASQDAAHSLTRLLRMFSVSFRYIRGTCRSLLHMALSTCFLPKYCGERSNMLFTLALSVNNRTIAYH